MPKGREGGRRVKGEGREGQKPSAERGRGRGGGGGREGGGGEEEKKKKKKKQDKKKERLL